MQWRYNEIETHKQPPLCTNKCTKVSVSLAQGSETDGSTRVNEPTVSGFTWRLLPQGSCLCHHSFAGATTLEVPSIWIRRDAHQTLRGSPVLSGVPLKGCPPDCSRSAPIPPILVHVVWRTLRGKRTTTVGYPWSGLPLSRGRRRRSDYR